MEKELTSILYKVYKTTSLKFSEKETNIIINRIYENHIYSASILISERYPSLSKDYRLKLLKSTIKDWDSILILINGEYFKYCKDYEKKYIGINLKDINLWNKLLTELSKDIVSRERYIDLLIKHIDCEEIKEQVNSIIMMNKLKN